VSEKVRSRARASRPERRLFMGVSRLMQVDWVKAIAPPTVGFAEGSGGAAG